jgi:hypothetical protein
MYKIKVTKYKIQSSHGDPGWERSPRYHCVSLNRINWVVLWMRNKIAKLKNVPNVIVIQKAYTKSSVGQHRPLTKGGIMCHGGVSILCWPVTPAVSPISISCRRNHSTSKFRIYRSGISKRNKSQNPFHSQITPMENLL